ncbi:hypothetical protein EQZ23_05405 [Sphingomonas sp. UV9]|uniref:hypothetical protein n=1 Tax=Sphingomonas sp. UV9 TaxID=1851410 RepID=UPI000FFC13C5|nr:hypothetical protein [Sphingomonas sp. UV9]RXD07466.1 hypothetical protein EQZ23_05405 [Sphingomonas sp. UV9]
MRALGFFPLAFAIVAPSVTLRAQTLPSTDAITAETNRIIAEKDRTNAEKDRINAQAELDRARVTSLGLPSFENKSTLGDGAGKAEALLLAVDTLGGAASLIVDKVNSLGTFIVLSGDELFDFSRYESVIAEMTAVQSLIDEALGRKPPGTADLTVASMMAAGKIVTGLLASETTITGFDLTNALSSRLLAVAVAGKLTTGYIPGAVIKTPSVTATATAYSKLVTDAQMARAARNRLPEKPTHETEKRSAVAIEYALTRFKAFSERATTPEGNNVAPIVAAGRMEALAKSANLVLRVRVEQASGSLINTKNIATTFGVDPVKVSGASIVSYLVTDTETGSVKGAGVLACRSTLTALRHVQTGAWRKNATGTAKQRCDTLI